MNSEMINSTINIGSMLLITLIAYGFIPVPVPEGKEQGWGKAVKILKVVGPIGLVAFVLLEIINRM
jgi:hypothetical protein